MAQHDYVIANGTGAAVRSDLNNALAAIVSQNSGATAPSTTYAYQWWADTTTGLLKLRNAANSGWITLFQLDGEWSTIALENGTAAAPSIYFKDSGTDTGFYSPGTDQVGISTGGTARLTIDSNGNVAIDTNTLYVDATNNRVGLGTSSPGSLLQVGTGALSSNNVAAFLGGSTTFENTTTGSGPSITFNNDTDTGILNPSANTIGINTGGNRAITISDAQRVGIGNTAPRAALDVTGNIFASGGSQIQITGNSGTTGLQLIGQDSAESLIGTMSAQALAFRTSSAERARIDSSGRLLVGTSSARANFFNDSEAGVFQVEGTSGTIQSLVGNANAQGGNPAFVLAKSRGTSVGSTTILQSDDRIGRISFQGSDGTQFVQAADIYAEVDGTPGADDMPGRLVFSTTADGASSPTERMRITNGGTLAVGTTAKQDTNNVSLAVGATSPGTPIETQMSTTSGNYAIMFRNPNGLVGNILTSGSSTSFNTSSDYRLKENVVPLTRAVDRINQLQVHRFNFIADPDKTVDGFIAHEAQAVVPECVTGTKDEVDADGNPIYQGIDQSKLVPLLTAALQEALAEIESLKARVTALEP